MVSWGLPILAWGHPATESSSPADPRARAAADAIAGPAGCHVADAALSWDHRSGRFASRGGASSRVRLDDGVWRLDGWAPSPGTDDASVRIGPQLLGQALLADLRYPTTPRRFVDWPSPVSTLPARSFGQVETMTIDRLEDGSTRVIQSFAWDGWKKVTGDRSVTFDPGGVAVLVEVVTTDRWRDGCTVRADGRADLDPSGLPTAETWSFDGNCPLRDWSGRWRIDYRAWEACGP